MLIAVAVASGTSGSGISSSIQKKFKWCVSFFAASLLNVELRSEGCDDPGKTGCGTAFIKVNNQDYSLHRRGFNVAVFTEQGICNLFNSRSKQFQHTPYTFINSSRQNMKMKDAIVSGEKMTIFSERVLKLKNILI